MKTRGVTVELANVVNLRRSEYFLPFSIFGTSAVAIRVRAFDRLPNHRLMPTFPKWTIAGHVFGRLQRPDNTCRKCPLSQQKPPVSGREFAEAVLGEATGG